MHRAVACGEPLYTIAEVATHVGMSVSAVRAHMQKNDGYDAAFNATFNLYVLPQSAANRIQQHRFETTGIQLPPLVLQPAYGRISGDTASPLWGVNDLAAWFRRDPTTVRLMLTEYHVTVDHGFRDRFDLLAVPESCLDQIPHLYRRSSRRPVRPVVFGRLPQS